MVVEEQSPATTVKVPRDMHDQVKEAAKEDYTTVSLWYEKVVREALAKRNGRKTK